MNRWDNAARLCLKSLTLSALVLAGCGRGSSPGDQKPDKASQSSSKGTSKTPDEEPEAAPETTGKSLTPDDVWFDKPLAVAAEAGNLATPGPKSADAPKPEKTPMSTAAAEPREAPAAAAGGGGWSKYITKDAIVAEVKQVRLKMKESLQTSGKYNAAYKKAIPEAASTLAALAMIVLQEPIDVSWKADAKTVRDLAADVQNKASGLGDQNYQATQKAWEELDGLFDGNKPGKAPDSPAAIPFPDIVKRGAAMRRMEAATNWMKQSVGSADALKKEQDRAVQEAAMLATMTRIIGMEGYDSADDDEYKKYVADMEKASLGILEAAKNGDFTAFSDGQSRGLKTCGECHTNFKP